MVDEGRIAPRVRLLGRALPGHLAYFTMMVPVMSGCMEQWYATVPAVLKVWV
jgi:hypothetical protein